MGTPRLRRAAMRRWGLTARRGRASGQSCRQYKASMQSALKIQTRPTPSDRSSASFRTLSYFGGHSIWRVRCGAVNHAPPHPLRQFPQPVAILVKHDDHTRLGILSRV